MKQIKVSIKLGDIHSIKLELTSFGEKKGADKYIYVTRINSSPAVFLLLDSWSSSRTFVNLKPFIFIYRG